MILFNKKATLYKYTTDNKWVSSYWSTWTLFACAIQPVWEKDWFEWIDILRTKKMYSNKQVEVWDKVVCDWTIYIVDSVQLRDWLKRKYYKSFINESNGN